MTVAGPRARYRRVLLAAVVLLLLVVRAAPAGADPEPEPSAPRLDVILDVAIAPPTITAGGLVTIEGTLTDENEVPIADAPVTVLLDDEESQDSRVRTDDSGDFQTFVEVPADQPAGDTSLVVSFSGNDSFTPGLKTFDLTVEEFGTDAPSDPPAPPTHTAGAVATGSVVASTTAPAETPDGTSRRDGRAALSWFYVALVVVGGGGLLVVGALAFRSRYGPRDDGLAREEGNLDALLVPDPEAEDDGAFLNDAFSVDEVESEVDGEVSHDPNVPEPPPEGPAPRRGLD